MNTTAELGEALVGASPFTMHGVTPGLIWQVIGPAAEYTHLESRGRRVFHRWVTPHGTTTLRSGVLTFTPYVH